MTTTTTRERISAREVAERIAGFRAIELPYPPQRELEERMEILLQVGRATRGEPQDCLMVLHPTFSGKTTCANRFARRVNAAAPEGRKPVVLARLPANASPRALVVALLVGLDERFSFSAKEEVLWTLWRRATVRHGVEIVMIDEVQHCSAGGFARGVTDTFKNMLADGPPLVLLGTNRNREMLTSNAEFNARLEAPELLDAAAWFRPDDRKLWTRLCARLDAAMTEADVVSAPTGLADEAIAEPLCAAAVGRIGLLKKLLQTALRIALSEGRRAIERKDLSRATQIWSVRNQFVSHNPFEEAA